MLLTARTISRTERAWLHETLDGDSLPGAGRAARPPDPHP
jgi:hypothetical protein